MVVHLFVQKNTQNSSIKGGLEEVLDVALESAHKFSL